MKEKPANIDEWWPCACVKRDKTGNLKKIKLHPPTTKKCRVCGLSDYKKPIASSNKG